MTHISRLPFMATITVVTSLALMALATGAFAAENEFSPYFTNTTPAALIDTGVSAVDVAQDTEPSAEGLNEIVPAAGDTATPDVSTATDAAIATDISVTPETSSGTPETE